MIQSAFFLRSVFNRLRPGHAAGLEYAYRQSVRESARARMHAVRREKRRILSTFTQSNENKRDPGLEVNSAAGTSGEGGEGEEEEQRPDHISKDGEWIAIYRFRSILPISLISQLKIVMSGAICVLCPYTAYLSWMNEEMGMFLESCGLTLATVLALILFTNITRRLIGVIAIKKDMSVIRVGYLNFWGFRRNDIIPLTEVIPLADTEPDIEGAMDSRKVAVRFQRAGEHENLFMSIYNTQIPEPELFEHVFGLRLPPESEQKIGLFRILLALMTGDTPSHLKNKAE